MPGLVYDAGVNLPPNKEGERAVTIMKKSGILNRPETWRDQTIVCKPTRDGVSFEIYNRTMAYQIFVQVNIVLEPGRHHGGRMVSGFYEVGSTRQVNLEQKPYQDDEAAAAYLREALETAMAFARTGCTTDMVRE